MSDDLLALQVALNGGPADDLTGPRRRLVDSVRQAPELSGVRDIAALARQSLIAAASSWGPEGHLDLPESPGLDEACRDASLQTSPFGASRIRISKPDRWNPGWLQGSSLAVDLAASAPGALRYESREVSTLSRHHEAVPADPAFTRATGFAIHHSSAQRDAVRAVALAPAGSVTHVVLPTGAGKSVVGYLRALLTRDGLTVMVVPTVAIALDQQRAVRELDPSLPGTLAWHGGLGQDERTDVRQRLRDGTQRLLITSPESIALGLDALVVGAAAAGHLKTLVVDEAHLVSEWGLAFRPEFQQIAAIREHAVVEAVRNGHQPPITVLQTATLNHPALELNDLLFGGHDDAFVAAPAVRTELRYLRSMADSSEERDCRMLEALRVLPRPLIVYATRKAEAARAYSLLRDDGHLRIRLFTGDTGADDRGEILAALRGDPGGTRADVVIGTSAFGLGVDQQDVRSVVHIAAPVSVGAYYQEVGRGGRDGHAAVAVMLTDRASYYRDTSIGDPTLIGGEKAWNRWAALRATLNAGSPKSVRRDALPRHLDRSNARGALWNLNTLVLMVRAGLIEFENLPFPADPTDDVAWEERRARVGIRLAVPQVTEESFEDRLHQLRSAIYATRNRDRAAVAELLTGGTCYGELFVDAYTFAHRLRSGVVARSSPAAACAGCPACGRDGLNAPRLLTPAATVTPRDPLVDSSLTGLLGGGKLLLVHEEQGWFGSGNVGRLADKFIRAGIRHVVAREHVAAVRQSCEQTYVALDEDVPFGVAPFIAPAVVMATDGQIDLRWRSMAGPVRIVVTVTGTPAPERPDYPIEEWWKPARTATELLEIL